MSGGHDDYAIEPIRGLPGALPEGETILWQGAPETWEIAKQVFHIRLVALYLLALTAWRVRVHLETGNLHQAMMACLSVLTISILVMGLVALLAWLCSRTSVYTITSRRIVMRIGIALPTAVNIPFTTIAAADLRAGLNGSGDISLVLIGEDRLAWSNFWPHVRPWKLARPQPMLRGIADVGSVAGLLGKALEEALPTGKVTPVGRSSGRLAATPPIAIIGGQTA